MVASCGLREGGREGGRGNKCGMGVPERGCLLLLSAVQWSRAQAPAIGRPGVEGHMDLTGVGAAIATDPALVCPAARRSRGDATIGKH